jgi:hypothetical protein
LVVGENSVITTTTCQTRNLIMQPGYIFHKYFSWPTIPTPVFNACSSSWNEFAFRHDSRLHAADWMPDGARTGRPGRLEIERRLRAEQLPQQHRRHGGSLRRRLLL